MIPERDQHILRAVARAADETGIPFFAVGAGARLLTHDWVLGVSGGRTTTDWDIVVRVPSWAEFERFRRALLDSEAADFVAGRITHQLLHTSGGAVDIIPYGGLETPPGVIAWPSGDQQMSVAVFAACETLCTDVELPGGTTVRAATVPAQVVMKAHAHAERAARGDSRDLRDIDFLLRTYAEHPGEERIFDVAASLITSGEISIEDAGAFLLGLDIATAVSGPVLEPLHRMVDEAVDAYGPIASTLAGHTWDEEEDASRRAAVCSRFAALGLGLRHGRPADTRPPSQ